MLQTAPPSRSQYGGTSVQPPAKSRRVGALATSARVTSIRGRGYFFFFAGLALFAAGFGFDAGFAAGLLVFAGAFAGAFAAGLAGLGAGLDGEAGECGGGADDVLHGGGYLASRLLADQLRTLGHFGHRVSHVSAAVTWTASWRWRCCGRLLLLSSVLIHHGAGLLSFRRGN